jgi:hypothetical protein
MSVTATCDSIRVDASKSYLHRIHENVSVGEQPLRARSRMKQWQTDDRIVADSAQDS